MSDPTTKPEAFTFADKLILDALKARGYSEDQITDFVNAARLHKVTLAGVVEQFEKAQKDVKEYFTPLAA